MSGMVGRLSAALTIVVIFMVLAGAAAPTGMAATESVAQLRRDGKWTIDDHGRIILVHGVNAVWKRTPYVAPDAAEGFTAADADWLATHGFNHVRLGVLFAGAMPTPGVIDQGYLDKIDRIVQLLAARHIWVLFDAHQDQMTEHYDGEGFPAWATLDGPFHGVPVVLHGFGPASANPGHIYAWDQFWNDAVVPGTGRTIQSFYGQFWTAVAARWVGQPYHAGYDIINEPFPGSAAAQCYNPIGCLTFDTEKLQAMQDRVIAAIRTVDQRNIVWLEPVTSVTVGAPNNFGREADPNAGYSWHDYCEVAPPVHPVCQTILGPRIWDNQAAVRDRIGAWLLSEFGAVDDPAVLTRVTNTADEYLSGWDYWHYKSWNDPTTCCPATQSIFANDADLGTAKVAKLRIIERTYPQATAGIPESLSYEPASGAFHYTYTPRPATAPTEIFVSSLHYPADVAAADVAGAAGSRTYAVEVSGACVTSEPGAAVLTLSELPGASRVDVRVTQGSGPWPACPEVSAAASLPSAGDFGPSADAARAVPRADLPATGGGEPLPAIVALAALSVVASRIRRDVQRFP